MNGSKALSVMLLLLAATISSVAESSTLLDYRKDAKKVTLRENATLARPLSPCIVAPPIM